MSQKIFDERERRVLIIAPCLINPSTVACGFYNKACFDIRTEFLKKLIDICYPNFVSIDVYRCPEYYVMKLPRPNSTKSFYEKFKEEIREIAKELVNKIKDYQQHGIKVLGIVGIEGSPCCGVTLTKYGRDWNNKDFERFKSEYEIGKDLTKEWYEPTYNDKGKGVFIEILEEELKKENLEIPIVGFPGKTLDELLDKIKTIISETLEEQP